jgi:arsenate reductase-like glutaredoxin family protein
VDAKKQTMDRSAAIALAREMNEVYATKGKNVIHLDMRTNPSDDEVAALVVGPSGNLRAPTLRRGKTLLVGFDAATYATLLTPK